MQNMKLRTKILSGFILITFIGVSLGAIGLISTGIITSRCTELREIERINSDINGILTAHFSWRNGITEAVMTDSEFTGSLDPDNCSLGKWLRSDDAKNIDDPAIAAKLKLIAEPHSKMHRLAGDVVGYYRQGDHNAAEALLFGDVLPNMQEVIALLTGVEDDFSRILDDKNEATIAIGRFITIILIVVIAAAIVLCIVTMLMITSSIIKPIQTMTSAAESLASGNLNVEVKYNVDDQIGRLAHSFEQFIDNTKEQAAIMEKLAGGDLTAEAKPRCDEDVISFAIMKVISNLNSMFQEIQNASVQVASGSNMIATGAQALAQGSTEQAATVQQLSASISAIANQTKANAEMAKRSASLANSIKRNAEKSNTQMDEMMIAVKELNQASQGISKVIKVIDEIAFQTNILSLNAAVEAARAGQHGRGFAVVADEVRNLAAKSAEAAKDTSELIANSIEKAELSARIAEETAASLDEIVSGINESTQIAGDIAKSSEEQTYGISQINDGIEQVALVVNQNSATAEESAAASHELSGQSSLLEELVSRFKIKMALGAPQSAPRLDSKQSRFRAASDRNAFGYDDIAFDSGKY